MVWLVNADWFSDSATTTPTKTAIAKETANRHLPDVVTAPPVPVSRPRRLARRRGLHRLDQAVGEPLVHLVEGPLDLGDEPRHPIGVVGREVRERGVGL